MPDKKPDGWEQSLKDMIATGKNHRSCEKELKALYGEEGAVGASTFQRYKKDLTGGVEADQGLKELGERKKTEKPKKPKLAPWTKQKQQAADTSKLAHLLNKGMYHGLFPMCKNKQLTEEQVQEVNLGGAVVGTIQHFVPDLNLDHPIVTLLTRGIMLYLRFKAVCSKITELKEKIVETVGGGIGGGIKPEFVQQK